LLQRFVTRPDLDPKANQLLAALPPGEFERWLPQLERVEMPLGVLGRPAFPSRSRRSPKCSP
jgi:hypothetical protein